MPEITPLERNKEYSVRQGFSFIWFKALRLANNVLNFFSLKQTTRFWGIVYDSVSKQPLDPVIVKLMYVDGREVETCVTDIAGRYGFLARPGKFKIYVRKTNYTFPSLYASGDSDAIYENLYHGEFFRLHEDYEVVAPNIPMDPVGQDWNQKAKKSVVQNYPYLKYFFKVVVALVFWSGFILDGAFIVKAYPSVPMPLYIVAVVYLFLLILSTVLPDARLWGKIKTNMILAPGESFFLELLDPKFPGISFGKATAKEDGKFLLRSNKGHYTISVSRINHSKNTQELLGSTKAYVGGEGVFNSTVVLK
jgi:hypothetical protein